MNLDCLRLQRMPLFTLVRSIARSQATQMLTNSAFYQQLTLAAMRSGLLFGWLVRFVPTSTINVTNDRYKFG
jgi:hypothetical protein